MPFDQASVRSPVAVLSASPVASVSLAEAKVGTQVRIIGVQAGFGLERRLTELGLPRGAEVAVVGRMGRRGAVIVAAHGSRLVVGADMAKAITTVAVIPAIPHRALA